MLAFRLGQGISLTTFTVLLLIGNALAGNVSLSPNKGIPGTLVVINGSALPANDKVNIYWESARIPIPVAMNIPTDGNGNFHIAMGVPKDTPVNDPDAGILVIGTTGAVGSSSFTVVDKVDCVDAYFIGVHGATEGPSSKDNNLKLSQVIEETWENFYSLAQSGGKKVSSYAVDYSAPVSWAQILEVMLPGVWDGRDTLGKIIDQIKTNCETANAFPKIVLAGYSLGAWVVNDWLTEGLGEPEGNWQSWDLVKAVELYGDPLWYRGGHDYKNATFIYSGLAAGVPNNHDPYTNTSHAPENQALHESLEGRWQSRCLKGDPVCGEGYNNYDNSNNSYDQYAFAIQVNNAVSCLNNSCEHFKYAKADGGYSLTERGANYLFFKTFPPSRPQVIMDHETFREGPLIFFRLLFTNPNNDATGFGFSWNGLPPSNYTFGQPINYGRDHLTQPSVEYPFNHACGTSNAYESDVDAWINYKGQEVNENTRERDHMACTAPCEVVTPYIDFTWDDVSSSSLTCSLPVPTPTPTPTPVPTPTQNCPAGQPGCSIAR